MNEKTVKIIRRSLTALHLLVGIGAMAGGLAAITNPTEPLGAPIDLLKNSPFKNFFIPGLFLFCCIGLGNIFGALAFRFNARLQAFISGMLGAVLMLWIIVQCFMLRGVVALHVIFFVIGLVQAALSAILLKRK